MYPTLHYLIKDLFGIDINLPFPTFGFMVALAFLTGAWLLTLELKRKEKNGILKPTITKILIGKPATLSEILINALIGFIIGFKFLGIVLQYSQFSIDPQQYILSTQGSWIGGIILTIAFAYNKYREKEKKKLKEPKWVEQKVSPHEHVGNIVMLAVVFGILGAKVFDSLDRPKEFFHHPIEMLISFSGLSIYGGLIFAGIAIVLYGRKKGIKPMHMCDAAAPALLASYAIGRIGCQLAGDGDWGVENYLTKPNFLSFLPDWMWGFDYPHNVIDAGIAIPGCVGKYCHVLPQVVFPTPFYETVAIAILFFILWSIRKKIHATGVVFCIYLMMNGFERFFIEHIRINVVYHFWGINATQAEIISPIFFIVGLFGIFYFNKKRKKTLNPN